MQANFAPKLRLYRPVLFEERICVSILHNVGLHCTSFVQEL